MNGISDLLKQQVLEFFENSREAIIRRARRLFLNVLLNSPTGICSADAISDALAIHKAAKRLLGAVPGPFAKAGLIERIGYIASTRPEAHARPISLWKLIDREGASQWLLTHPELSDECEVSDE